VGKRSVGKRSVGKRRKNNRSKSQNSDSNRSDNAIIRSFSQKYIQKSASRTIGNFMKKTENKRRSMFLQAICSDSGVCIAFGKERQKIFDFFDGFTKFNYLKNIKAIGAVSENGFIKELEYEREGYKAHAILKSSREKMSDNLMYEYFVGIIINEFAKRIPCFIETYGHYEYTPLNI